MQDLWRGLRLRQERQALLQLLDPGKSFDQPEYQQDDPEYWMSVERGSSSDEAGLNRFYACRSCGSPQCKVGWKV